MRPTGESMVLVLPQVSPFALLERDVDALVGGPYALCVDDILAYLQAIVDTLAAQSATVDRVRELCRRTAPYPDIFLDGAFAEFELGLDVPTARAMIDRELAAWQRPGSAFLDGWTELPGEVTPGIAPLAALGLPGAPISAAGSAGLHPRHAHPPAPHHCRQRARRADRLRTARAVD